MKIKSQLNNLFTGKNTKRFVLAGILFFLTTCVFALKVPFNESWVTDTAGLMTVEEKQQAIEYLSKVESATGIQIFVLTVKSLEGENLEEFATKVFDAWKIGQKDKNNGVLLIVAYQEHDLRIQTGYGVEGILTDTKCGQIIRNVIIPEFKEGDYGEGINKGIKTIGGIIAGDESALEALQDDSDDSANSAVVTLIFMMVWMLIVMSGILSRYGIWGLLIWNLTGRRGPRPKRKIYHSSPNVTIHTSSFGHSSSSFGGSSGGGSSFHGGGGDFSGGGGASGHW